MEKIKKVLDSYSIYPLTINEITERVYWISDGQQEYALKRSLLSMDSITNWENIYKQAFSQNLSNILPVYLTKNGKLYTEMMQSIFYLTPWINRSNTKKNQQTIELIYGNIGKLHAKTKQAQLIPTETLIRNFNTYKKFCQDIANNLLRFVEQFEKKRYMSPFELLVCTQYRDIEYALKEINKRIEQLIDFEEEQISWNYSLCHGNLEFSHMLFANQTHLINFEKAAYENAVMDLAVFFKNEVTYYDSHSELLMDLFSAYMKENKLTTNELHLLTIHLLDPTDYITIVQRYVNKNTKETVLNNVIQLQHAYRKVLFGMRWSSYVEREYETISFEDLES